MNNERKRTFLSFQACRYGHVQHLEHLLFYGADMSAQNASGNTALHVCALYNQVRFIIKMCYTFWTKWLLLPTFKLRPPIKKASKTFAVNIHHAVIEAVLMNHSECSGLEVH